MELVEVNSEFLKLTHNTLPVARFAHTFVPFTPELRPKSADAPSDRRKRVPRLLTRRHLPRPLTANAAREFVPKSPEIRPAAVETHVSEQCPTPSSKNRS